MRPRRSCVATDAVCVLGMSATGATVPGALDGYSDLGQWSEFDRHEEDR